MRNIFRAAIATVSIAVIVVATFAGTTTASADGMRLYRVTVTNTTSGQPLSPPVIATHSPSVSIFTPGARASEGVWTIAEQGNNAVLGAALNGAPGIYKSIATDLPVRRTGGNGPEGSGTSLTVLIEAREGDALSVVAMLGCTNDGFAGASSIPLPEGFVPMSMQLTGYDAGTEQNTERSADLADGCGTVLGADRMPADGNLRVPTAGGVITTHPGLTFGGTLTGASAWFGSPGQVFIQRVR